MKLVPAINYLQVGKADPVPALQVPAIQDSGDRVRLPNLQIIDRSTINPGHFPPFILEG
jgi:hypothetical protein